MKTIYLSAGFLLLTLNIRAQSNTSAGPIIEGGKVIVELIKAFGPKKDNSNGCKGSHADVCVNNQGAGLVKVYLYQRTTDQRRELIVSGGSSECSLQIGVGVWTYELKRDKESTLIRKGDLLIEGCQNVLLTIRF
ncbi:MAG TPA: hypothetical protein VEA37_08020 [Flavobacterium sp.]|nr:hypothetical protein [Flavobacterium sp.]